MSRQLLDTDILSEIVKGKDKTVAERAIAYLHAEGRFTTTAVTVAEVVYGFRRMGREDRIAAFEASLSNVDVLPFDDAAARIAGRINADLQGQGRIIGMPDVMIAAIALHHGLTLVTGNSAHFEYVRALGHELGLDNWRDATTQAPP
jgi:predicted nucleic acid-binding protein